MTHTVVGLFDNRSEAQAAMQELVRAGFIQEDIDLSNRSLAETTETASTDTGIGDSISNFFSSLFTDDEQTATSYTNAAYDADAILTVQVDSEARAREASEIFDRYGAIDVDERNAQYNRQNYATTTNTDRTDYSLGNETENRAALKDEAVIPVVEEELQVGKREVERGAARVRSRVIEKPVEANVRLREEHVVVNRRPVNRAVTNEDLNNFREGEIELTERAEVPIVGKQARVVEEVEIGKTVEEREQTVSDTVRRTDVEVEEIDRDDDIGHTGTRRATS